MGRIGVSESQFRILEHLKRKGTGTIPALATDTGLSVETVRSHMKSLLAAGLILRQGSRRGRKGRPEEIFGLTDSARPFFPSQEADLLPALVQYLVDEGKLSSQVNAGDIELF